MKARLIISAQATVWRPLRRAQRNIMKKPVINGILASLSLLLVYVAVMMIATRSWSTTISQFRGLWYWIMALSLGFGIQVGLYSKLKILISNPKHLNQPGMMTAASGGTSTIGMIACCAHHLSEVLPIIGLSGFAVFLVRYQTPLIVLGVAMNLLGTCLIWKKIKPLS